MNRELHLTASPARPRHAALALWLLAWLVLAALFLAATAARAGSLPGELPALAGRLSTLAGDVRWFDRDSGAWVQSSEAQPLRNWPLAPGDRLRTGAGGRAELRIGSTTLRLGADAELWLPRLDEQAVLLHLQAGSLALRLAEIDRDGFGPVEMLTREGRWLPQRPGHYRLDRERDATQASAWRGELRFESRDSTLNIGAGRRADLWQDAGGTTRYAWAGIERDGFADWVARDERQDDAPISARYVPPGMSGWQDLDRHGDWIDEPQHGMVWQPRQVAPGWVPFHDGRWAWVAPWGWTWIDAAPWGFAPFHYGSWLTVGGRWSWSPGARHERPRFAPALSGWVSRPHVGVSIQIGGRPPPPRVVVPVVVVVPQRPAPRPIIVMPREPEGRHHRGPHDGREPDRRGDERRGDERRGDDRRGDERRGDSGRANERRADEGRTDERRGEPRRFDAPRFEGPRREDRRSDAGPSDAQRAAGPERPLPAVEAAAAVSPMAAPAGPPAPRTLPAAPPISQPAPPRTAEAPVIEPPRRGLPTPVGRGPRDAEEPREARSPRAERPERVERVERADRPERVERADRPERRERRVDDVRRERDEAVTR